MEAKKELLKYLKLDMSNFNVITDATRSENSKRIFTGGVRINNSLYRTQHEDDTFRKKVLNTKLP